MKKNALYFLIPFLLSFLSGCLFSNKPAPTPEPQLPPETQEGKNTFGCMLNGKVWILNYECSGNDLVVFLGSSKFFSVTTKANVFEGQLRECHSLGFSLDISKGLGKYKFTDYTDAFYRDTGENGYFCEYGLVPDQEKPIEGFIEITKIDTQKQFIAGRFAFTLTKQGCDTVRVRDGRFDLRF